MQEPINLQGHILERKDLEEMFNSKLLMKTYNNIPEHVNLMSDIDLVNQLQPTRIDWRLRIRTWDLIHKAYDTSNEYDIICNVDINDRICNKRTFNEKIRKELFVAFMFRPIESYSDELDTMLAVTQTKMWQLVTNLNVLNSDGSVNYKASDVLMKLHDKLLDRKLGTVRHLIEMKKIQMNINTGASFNEDLEAIDAQIAKMEETIEIAKPKPNKAAADEKGASD